MQFAHTTLSRLSIGYPGPDGTHITRRFVNHAGQLVEAARTILQPVEPDGTDAAPHEPPSPVPPTQAAEAPSDALQGSGDALANLLAAAREAAVSLERFVQLHDPSGKDLKNLSQLRAALDAFTTAPSLRA